MRDLVEWLTAILDERERREYGKRKYTKDYWGRPCPACGEPVTGIGLTELAIEHRVYDRRHKCYVSQEVYDEFNGVESNPDPAVLADIAAKRAIIETCAHYIETEGPSGSQRAGVCDDILRALASAYKHEPGYLEEWGPS